MVPNCAVNFAVVERVAVCGGVDLNDNVLDVPQRALVGGRGCLPSKAPHHLSEAVEEDRVLVPETIFLGPKKKIKLVPSIVDRKGLGEDLLIH